MLGGCSVAYLPSVPCFNASCTKNYDGEQTGDSLPIWAYADDNDKYANDDNKYDNKYDNNGESADSKE